MNNYIKILPALFIIAGYNIENCDAMNNNYQFVRKNALTQNTMNQMNKYDKFEKIHNSIIQVIDYILYYK